MRKPKTHKNPLLWVSCAGLVASSAMAQFDELQNYGDARTDGGGPGTFTDNGGGSFSISAGGGDFWGNYDNGSFLTASDGSLTTTSDFTATVRHVGTTNPTTNDWGREPLMMRAQPASGGGFDPNNPKPIPADPNSPTNPDNGVNSGAAHWGAFVRSGSGAADQSALWRDNPGTGTGEWARNGGNPNRPPDDWWELGGSIADRSSYMAISREGGVLHAGTAADLSFQGATGVPGRWVEMHSRGDHPSITAGTEVTVGIGHQSHNAIPVLGGDGQNVATFDSFNFTNGSHDASKFGARPAADYNVGGSIAVDPSGAVTGAAYTFENGAATGEATGWRVVAQRLSAPQLGYGVAYQKFDTAPADTASLVPAANFRRSAGNPGLQADIYLAGNAGNLAGNRALITGAPDGTTVIPDVWWAGPGNGPANGYPDAAGVSGADEHGGANATNLFATAVAAGSAVAGAFEGNQDNYGVHMTGEIFIPGGTGGTVAFEIGVDDYKYLNIDGQALMDNNSWSGQETTQNAGGTLALFDSSGIDAAGEWVSFEMIMWEGGGGDTAALYWDASGGAGFDPATYPTFTTVETEITMQGTNQIGSDVASGAFGTLPAGTWDSVTLDVINTGRSASVNLTGVTVVPEPGAIALIALSGLALIFRRRK